MSQQSLENISFLPTPDRLNDDQHNNWESRLRVLQTRRDVKIDELDEIDREIESCQRMLGRVAVEDGLRG